MAGERVQRRLAAILAADVVAYSRLMGEDEEGTRSKFNDCLESTVEPALEAHHGRLVKTMGDGFLVEFPSVLGAVQAAIDIQSSWPRREQTEPRDRRLELRIGIHSGDVIVEGDDIHGEGVNIAARLEGLAEPNGICVSDVVHAGIRKKFAIAFEDLGEQSLKNIAEPVQAFRVALEAPDQTHAQSDDALFRRPAVAVLPFENLSGDAEQEYFGDGLTEDIITALSLWRSFPVIARNSTFAFKGQSPDIRKVGKELGARYVIEGSVRRGGNRVRVTAQLINADTGHHVWAERYDRDLDDIFDLQDELTQRIAATVVPELEHAEHAHAAARAPQDLDAWMWYVRGTAELYKTSGEGRRRAREMFDRAVQIDPNYAGAHAAIAFSHAMDLLSGTAESREGARKGLEDAARKAVSADRDDSMAQMVMSFYYTWTEQDDLAVATARRAVELNPNNAIAHNHLGTLLDLTGLHEDGIAGLEHALRLNPREPLTGHTLTTFLARANIALRRYEQAVSWAREALAWGTDYAPAHYLKGIALAHLDRADEARAAFDECERVQPGFVNGRRDWRPYRDPEINEHILDGLRKSGWDG